MRSWAISQFILKLSYSAADKRSQNEVSLSGLIVNEMRSFISEVDKMKAEVARSLLCKGISLTSANLPSMMRMRSVSSTSTCGRIDDSLRLLQVTSAGGTEFLDPVHGRLSGLPDKIEISCADFGSRLRTEKWKEKEKHVRQRQWMCTWCRENIALRFHSSMLLQRPVTDKQYSAIRAL